MLANDLESIVLIITTFQMFFESHLIRKYIDKQALINYDLHS